MRKSLIVFVAFAAASLSSTVFAGVWMGVWEAVERHSADQNGEAAACSIAKSNAQQEISDAGGTLSRFGSCNCRQVGDGTRYGRETTCRQEVWYVRDKLIKK